MEHTLLTTFPMRRSRASCPALLILAALTCAIPSTAFANSPTVGAFGTGNHMSTGTNLVTAPIGVNECATPIPLTFSGLTTASTTRYVDVWWASSAAANCQTNTVRATTTSPVCRWITSIPYTSGPNVTIMPTAETLFGGCTTDQRTFFFFDTTTMDETSMTFTTYWTLDVAIDATAPNAPQISSTPAGDTQIQIAWNASTFTDLGLNGKVNVYSGGACSSSSSDGSGADGGTGTLTAGGAAPATALATLGASNPATLQTSLLGWSSSSYGESTAIAIAVVDTAGNVSTLSNVVCAQHVRVTGFWEQYCAEHGMPDIAQCTANYHGCSVGLPGRRTDLGAIAFVALVVGLGSARRARRRIR